jgi:hypothetical protein
LKISGVTRTLPQLRQMDGRVALGEAPNWYFFSGSGSFLFCE